MNKKRFVTHDTLVKDYVEILESKNKREDEARCEIAGKCLRNEKNNE